ncbi:SAM-dependent methyltransferase [Frankia sp. AgKG'84/4]|uniref:SAM-dependent methyltransferase n=1 Tax=Frankia sp. AgKG'84/4 TaxID=573490 RepID=UPI0035B42886
MTTTDGPQPAGRMAWTRLTTDRPPVDLAIDKPHSARMYDYYLGGKDNFPADREAAAKVIAAAPSVPQMARENRAFMVRAIRHLAAEAGIRQFLDIGTGRFREIYLSHGDDGERRFSPEDPCPRVLSAC